MCLAKFWLKIVSMVECSNLLLDLRVFKKFTIAWLE